ncbi:hypothetical protein CALCODRAFT_509091 [Calocera cornea HHB12733]|uniref:Uncharacterized protein n=1 Tax=Calocera cornea HHB12733 TaxID=1353952 RepID=A0A165FNR8_9BASI|nr:hypothetical protein CALCODRAFT_509091 [Calocera cornea HHB12733]
MSSSPAHGFTCAHGSLVARINIVTKEMQWVCPLEAWNPNSMDVDEQAFPLPNLPACTALPYTPPMPIPNHARSLPTAYATTHMINTLTSSMQAIVHNATLSTLHNATAASHLDTVNHPSMLSSSDTLPVTHSSNLASSSLPTVNPHDLRMQLDRERLISSQAAFMLQQRSNELLRLGRQYRKMHVRHCELKNTMGEYMAEYSKLLAEHNSLKKKLA